LARLLAIRRVREELDRRELQRSLSAVAEAEHALERQHTALAEARLVSRAALAEGDREEWLLADTQGAIAGWNQKRLEAVRSARAAEVPAAMTQFVESRREHEQAKHLVADAKRADQLDTDRRGQAAADDWYLSRYARAARAIQKIR
jgi:hypothetical protein